MNPNEVITSTFNRLLGGLRGTARPHDRDGSHLVFETRFRADIGPVAEAAVIENRSEDAALDLAELLYGHAQHICAPYYMLAKSKRLRDYVNDLVRRGEEFPE